MLVTIVFVRVSEAISTFARIAPLSDIVQRCTRSQRTIHIRDQWNFNAPSDVMLNVQIALVGGNPELVMQALAAMPEKDRKQFIIRLQDKILALSRQHFSLHVQRSVMALSITTRR